MKKIFSFLFVMISVATFSGLASAALVGTTDTTTDKAGMEGEIETDGGGGSGETTNTDPVCGNGVWETGEQCDDGNLSNLDGCLNTCTIARCGDHYVRTGVEECDDGNNTANDGCSSTCQLEAVDGPILNTNPEPTGDSSNDVDPTSTESRSTMEGDGSDTTADSDTPLEESYAECVQGDLVVTTVKVITIPNNALCSDSCNTP